MKITERLLSIGDPACIEAADEIERLHAALDEALRVMNNTIADYRRLMNVAYKGDTLSAYQLGIKHAMEGHDDTPK